jgi:hypothetical protein
MVGDGHAMGVTAQISEHILRASEWTFRVDHPGSQADSCQRILAAPLRAEVFFLSSNIRPLFVRFFSLFFLRFLGLTAPAIPVRSGLRVFCFPGSALTIGSPQNADANLRLPAPSLLVVPQETGAENER